MLPVLAIAMIVVGIADDLGGISGHGILVAGSVGILLTAWMAWAKSREKLGQGGNSWPVE